MSFRVTPVAIVLAASTALINQGCNESSVPDSSSPEAEAPEPAGPPPRRVVAYLPTYRSLNPENVDFDTITHLCIAFANPTGEGSESDFELSAREKIAPLVSAAHEKGVLVLASIAGGTKESGELVGEQITEERRDAYIAGLLDLIERYDLDGIDVDIEGEAVTETYTPFVKQLGEALPEGKLMTAAIATKNGPAFDSAALGEYDFLNLMAYDHCSWSDEACDQASLEGVEEDLRYWLQERSIPEQRLVLGVPFYGWCWGCGEQQMAMTYAQIVSQYPEAKTENWIRQDGKEISLNSAATIATKADWGLDLGGVMIWELGQDARGEDSLMAVIAERTLEVD